MRMLINVRWLVGIMLCFIPLTLIGCKENVASVPVDGFFPDGSWVLYKVAIVDSEEGEITGTLKVSVVGHEKLAGVNHFWLEFDRTLSTGKEVIKFLVSKASVVNFAESFQFWGDVKQIIIKTGTDKPKQVQELQLKKFMPTFIENKRAKRFGKTQDLEPLVIQELGLEKLSIGDKQVECKKQTIKRHFVSRVNLGFIHMEDQTDATAELWISGKVPFGGLAKVIYTASTTSINKINPEKSQTEPSTYQAHFELLDFAKTGAVSAITEPVEMMESPMFPFLKNGDFIKKKSSPKPGKVIIPESINNQQPMPQKNSPN